MKRIFKIYGGLQIPRKTTWMSKIGIFYRTKKTPDTTTSCGWVLFPKKHKIPKRG